jgi:hypothetical protein
MPAIFKVVIAVNVGSVLAIAFAAVLAGGGFVSAVFPPDEGHELRLVPINRDAAVTTSAVSQPLQRAEVPFEYRRVEPAPSPWVILPDGSVRMVRTD